LNGDFIVTDLIEPNSIPVADNEGWKPDPNHPRRRPPWIKVRAPGGETFTDVHRLMSQHWRVLG
jgi:lipoate synthase